MENIYKETFIELFTNPREAFKKTIDLKLDKYQILLLILAGISSTLSRAIENHIGNSLSLIGIITVCIIVGALFGWFGLFILSGLLSFTGKWINGKARTPDILNIVSYASIPVSFSIVIYIVYILAFGVSIFQENFDIYNYETVLYLIYVIGLIIHFFLIFYYLFFLVIGISVVQGLSIGKSLLNILLAVSIIVIPLIFIGFLISFFR